MPRPPSTFHDLVGQKRPVRFVRRLIAGSKKTGQPCPHLLFSGPSGHGKTCFARAVAEEYDSDSHLLMAGKDAAAVNICEVLYDLKFGDVFFIDEAHGLNRDAEEILLPAIDENKALAIKDNGRLDRTEFLSVAAFTLILATTEPGKITRSLRQRVVSVELDPYSVPELKLIAKRVATHEGVDITPQAARRLAEVAQGTPRLVAERLRLLRRLFAEECTLDTDHVRNLLEEQGIDDLGLWPHQRQYLRILGQSRHGEAPFEHLMVQLGCDSAHIRQDIEPYLVTQDLVCFSRGRTRRITEKGRTALTGILAMDQQMANDDNVGEDEG